MLATTITVFREILEASLVIAIACAGVIAAAVSRPAVTASI